VAQISEEKFGLIATSIKNAKTDNFFLVLVVFLLFSELYTLNLKKEEYALFIHI
jgi:uncharacterized membrane protein